MASPIDTKIVNIRIAIRTMLIIVCLILTVTLFVKPKQETTSVNFGNTFNFNDYQIKLSDCKYDSSSKTLTINIYAKAKISTKNTLPDIYSVAAASDLDTALGYSIDESPDNEYCRFITISGVEPNEEFIRIYLESTTPGYKQTDKLDDFGNVIEGAYIDPVTRYAYIIISSSDFISAVDSTEISQTTSTSSKNFLSNTEPSKTAFSSTSEYKTTPEDQNTVPLTTFSSRNSQKEEQITTSGIDTTASTTTVSTTSCSFSKTTTLRNTTTTTKCTTTTEKTTTTSSKTTTTTNTTTTKATTTTTKTTTTKPVTTTTVLSIRGLKIACPVAVDGIITLNVGETAQLTPVFTPNGASAAVVWSSKKPDVVAVDSSGKITAITSGSTIIKCSTSDGQFEVGIMVTVRS